MIGASPPHYFAVLLTARIAGIGLGYKDGKYL
jgi:hypothetical protein